MIAYMSYMFMYHEIGSVVLEEILKLIGPEVQEENFVFKFPQCQCYYIPLEKGVALQYKQT